MKKVIAVWLDPYDECGRGCPVEERKWIVSLDRQHDDGSNLSTYTLDVCDTLEDAEVVAASEAAQRGLPVEVER